MTTIDRIVLAYSGGPDASAAILWLKAHYRAEIIALTLDIGQENDLESIRDRAISAGAERVHVLDVREELLRDFFLPAVKADAMCDDGLRLMKALARLLVARKLVEIAAIEQATAVAHGCSGGVDDQAQLEAMIRALNPALKIISAAREWSLMLADEESPADAVVATTPSSQYAGEPANVEIAFDQGVPVAINGVSMPLADLVSSLGTIAGEHGLGQAAVILHTAHRELQRLAVSDELDGFARIVSRQYAQLVYEGQWATPLRTALDGFVERVQERVTGVIQLQLFKSRTSITGCRSSFVGDAYTHEESLVADS